MTATVHGDAAMRKGQDYWRAKLSGLRGSSGPPLDFPRPDAYAGASAEADFGLPADVQQSLLKLTGDSPFLLYVALLTALNVCLHKYAGGETVVVGSPARRKQAPQPPNAVAVVSELSGRTTFRELLMGVRATLLEAYAEQSYDFRRLLEDLRLDHVRDKCPLFDVVLVLEDIHGAPPPELRNDVTITFARGDGGLVGRAEFNERLFTGAGIERFRRHYEQALRQGLARPDARMDDISILDDEERRRLLVEWNATEADYPRDLCIHQLFERQAALTPGATALVHGDAALTYAELDERADRLASHLRSLGVGPEVVVGLCAGRSVEAVVGLLGILKAGAAYLPLDPEYPPDRLRFMLEDASVSVLLTQEKLKDRLGHNASRVLCLDADWEPASRQGGEALTGGATVDNLAYVIYTSGSTGRPKGVMVGHRGLSNLVEAQREFFGVGPGARVLQFASLSFDASVSEVFMALCAGATLCLAPADKLLPGPELIELLGAQGINIVTLPPSALLALPPAELPELKTVVAAGEACPAEAVERWAAGRRFVNAYGPTEVTVMATGALCRAGDSQPHIGRPINNKSAHVLDGASQPAPVGVVGELHVGGEGLARGYLGRPSLTAERFVPDPFSASPGARLYRTGDLVRRRPTGDLDFLGRVDHQVKVRGYRIEVEEVEARLGQHPSVARCVVAARADGGGERLVAYVVGRGDELPGAGELRGFLSERLPDYMVPSVFVALDELPLNANGKVDRGALPAPGATHERGAVAQLRTQAEGVLSAMWAEVLGLESVGAEDNFFDLGGHSLLATRVFSRVREAFKVELPIRTIFEAPTVAQLARRIEGAAGGGLAQSAPPIRRAPRAAGLPLSFGQQRLWFLHRLDPTTPLYNIPGAMRLTGRLDVAAMGRCFTEVVRRHESLRTTFETDEAGRPVQVIAPPARFELPVFDLCALPADEREAEAERRANEEARRPFDLARGPLLRASLLRLGPQDHVLTFAMHHIVSDGWSLGILAREVSVLYEAFSAGAPSPLSELPVQYADYAVWQREWLTGDVLERELSYWRGQLASAPPRLDLPFARPRPPVSSPRGAMRLVRLPESLTQSLRALSRREGVTLYMTLLAAFQTLLYRYSGQPNVVVGSPIANRDRPEVEGLIGFFINVLALHTDLSGNPTFAELLARVRETTLGAYAHHEVPFEKLVSELRLEREPGFAPVFQAVFVLQNMPLSPLRLTRLTFGGVRIDKGTTQADLYLSLTEAEGGLTGVLKYNTDIFDAPTAARVVEDYEALLTEVAARPEMRVLELELRPERAAGRAASRPSQVLSYRDDQFAF
ncbi:MAG TPA: amino acid adenylation domain-containing protein [Pyrinomonadaceae bacterium]|nr:amino acid adenylation domain-containing protein [Pyrinomonadaceae bacterium]